MLPLLSKLSKGRKEVKIKRNMRCSFFPWSFEMFPQLESKRSKVRLYIWLAQDSFEHGA